MAKKPVKRTSAMESDQREGVTSNRSYGGVGTGGVKRKPSLKLSGVSKKVVRKSKKLNQAKGRKY
jgi:hypothetical protein